MRVPVSFRVGRTVTSIRLDSITPSCHSFVCLSRLDPVSPDPLTPLSYTSTHSLSLSLSLYAHTSSSNVRACGCVHAFARVRTQGPTPRASSGRFRSKTSSSTPSNARCEPQSRACPLGAHPIPKSDPASTSSKRHVCTPTLAGSPATERGRGLALITGCTPAIERRRPLAGWLAPRPSAPSLHSLTLSLLNLPLTALFQPFARIRRVLLVDRAG